MGSGAAEHGSDRGEDLAKLVVKFTGNVTQRGFLRGNELLGEFAAALGNFLETREEAAVPADQRQAGQYDGEKRRGEKEVDLAAHTIVDLYDTLSGLFFAFAVLHEEAGHGGAECGLALLQRKLDLTPRFLFPALAGKGEDAIDGVPELRERTGEKGALLGSAADGCVSGFKAHGIVEIGADALELR